jgi:cytidine deaminase
MSQNPNTIIERVAITVKSHNGSSLDPVAPCGACRQVIAEYEHRQGKKIEIIFSGESGRTIIVKGIENLLPFTFNSDNLPQ